MQIEVFFRLVLAGYGGITMNVLKVDDINVLSEEKLITPEQLKRQIKAAEKKGYRVKTGVECEFFLINRSGDEISDDMDREEKPCYDQSALMRRYDVISEICDAMLGLGWNPYQNLQGCPSSSPCPSSSSAP